MTAERWERRPKRRRVSLPIEGDSAQAEENQAAIELLRSWREAGDEAAEEQREIGAYLIEALNADRARRGARLLFP